MRQKNKRCITPAVENILFSGAFSVEVYVATFWVSQNDCCAVFCAGSARLHMEDAGMSWRGESTHEWQCRRKESGIWELCGGRAQERERLVRGRSKERVERIGGTWEVLAQLMSSDGKNSTEKKSMAIYVHTCSLHALWTASWTSLMISLLGCVGK